MSALVAAAIHCPLSENATGQNVTVMFSQNESQGKFCPPTVTDFITAEAIALINYTLWGCFTRPPPPPNCLSGPYCLHCSCSSSTMGTPQFPLVLASLDWRFDVSVSAPSCVVYPGCSPRMGTPHTPSGILYPHCRSSV
jgi:hypothetical protein